MRLRSVGLCVLVSAMLTGSASACAQSDRRASDARAATPSPTPAAPVSKVGNCYLNVIAISFPSSDLPMDCAKPHRAETFHVGTFTGENASRSNPPPMGSPALRSAFDACDPVAKRLVGGDWRGGRLSIQVVVPGPPSWTGGSRWYRCDIFELDALEGGTHRQNPQDHAIERTGSLRGALTRRLPLVYTCFNEDKFEILRQIACNKPHRFEFVGIWTAPELRYEDLEGSSGQFLKSCWAAIGTYIGASKKVDMSDYIGVTYRPPSLEAWGRGDRGIKCFLWSDDRNLTRSVKGAGLRALN
jgi:Septum formation